MSDADFKRKCFLHLPAGVAANCTGPPEGWSHMIVVQILTNETNLMWFLCVFDPAVLIEENQLEPKTADHYQKFAALLRDFDCKWGMNVHGSFVLEVFVDASSFWWEMIRVYNVMGSVQIMKTFSKQLN